MIKGLHPNIKNVINKSIWWVAGFFGLCLLTYDLDRPGGGYIQLSATFIFFLSVNGVGHIIELLQTPIASLTILKIFALILYLIVIKELLIYGYQVLSWIIKKALSYEDSPSNTETYNIPEPDDECVEFVWAMRKAKGAGQLDSMLYHAIGKWPQWERQLTLEYEAIKKRLRD